jgi:hypothetical protein
MTLTAGACGNGLFTTSPLVITIDGGSEADGGADVPPNADGAADARPGADGRPSIDAPSAPDGPSDSATPGSNWTAIVDWQGGEVDLGDASLIVPKEAFSQPTIVTLTLVSDDGRLDGYPGPIGPIYSVSKADAQQKADAQPRPVPLQHAASFTLAFRPADASIPEDRVALAYLDTLARLWIIVSGSSYKAATGLVTGSVFDFSGTQLLAPIVSCLIGGQTCSGGQTCLGGACQ